MLRQAEELPIVNISGGVGGNGGKGGEQGGGGGVGEGPTTNFGGLNADTMHFVIQNHWPGHARFRPSEGASYESSSTSHNSGNTVNFHGMKRRRDEFEGRSHESDSSLLAQRVDKRRRLDEDEDEIEIIPRRNLKLIRQIGSGSGYFLHAAQNNADAVVVKVFNRGAKSAVRRQLESTVALAKGIMHSNVLPLLGISPPDSFPQFIVYENVQDAEGPLAMALKTDLRRSITLGFKMVYTMFYLIFHGSHGIRIPGSRAFWLNHLFAQGVFAGHAGAENFDVFLDVNDRFVISVHPPLLREETETAERQDPEGNAWVALNALCRKTLTSANRVLHHEEITRDPGILDAGRARSTTSRPPLWSGSAPSLQNIQDEIDVPPRREYVWRTMDHGRQSLENIARRITLDLDMHCSSLSRINQTDGRTPHRCAGYVREEITLATTTLDSAVVAHDAPSALERCLICHEVVDVLEEFRCECGDLTPGSQHTIKCQVCKFWSHSDCAGNSRHEFICQLCIRPEELNEGISNEWKPAPGAPGVPPLDSDPSPPLPDLPQAKPGWRTVHQRAQRKTKKKNAGLPPLVIPAPNRHQVQSWATWQPDPNLAPTPPSHSPTLLVPDTTSPGLFGPRSPSSPPSRDRERSWATWQPDPGPPPPPDLPQAKPGWRAVHQRATATQRKTKKKDAAPPPSPTWQCLFSGSQSGAYTSVALTHVARAGRRQPWNVWTQVTFAVAPAGPCSSSVGDLATYQILVHLLPPPGLPQARPGWRTVHQRATTAQRKAKKKDAAPPPPPLSDHRRVQSWATWQPDPNWPPTPPPREPTLLTPDVASPGLFGPRSPSSPASPTPDRDQEQSWATQQPDLDLAAP
ncbi:hypothetical protein MSAN_01162700 [Mycena sanguinolenta]|uniref:Protein kinase domain-containing protein n=1 Tax=Mycena sanguinolenta TaxID=230812 RepID=A0A8H7D6M1_9AGAR|nr:hypothetical protein MSAN_01162700 [Mycena sanguinolenta]